MLDTAQAQLEARFETLRAARQAQGYPVYALEHGLPKEEIEALEVALRRTLRSDGLDSRHWLVWLIVSAEVGYAYDGEEYWSSFETGLPEWIALGDRNRLRIWFQEFQTRYGGVTPTGRWADHFSIIAWPIAHAVLPRYLQGYFARHLYDLRYELAQHANASLEVLGELLRQGYGRGAARFEQFLQQTDLTARFVLALRDEDLEEDVPRLEPVTLQRIVADLERRRDARDFLRAARQVIRDGRLRVGPSLAAPADRPSAPDSTPRISGPRLAGRRAPDHGWTLAVTMPDFAAALKRGGLNADLLSKVRVRLYGQTDTWMPGLALLGMSRQDRVLTAFPAPGSPVLERDRARALLGDILEPLSRLADAKRWLLRRHADGIAREVLGGHVRPGQRYLLISRDPVPKATAEALSLSSDPLNVPDVQGYSFTAPNRVSASYRQALASLDLGFFVGARIEPVGLTPRWDAGTQSTVWRPHEAVILHLTADFDVAEFIISIHGGERLRVTHSSADVILSLGRLPIGEHCIEVAAVPVACVGHNLAVEPAILAISVRAPVPWQDAVSERAGFRLLLEPANAKLEDLLSDRAALELHAPPTRRALLHAETFDAQGHLAHRHEIGQASAATTQIELQRMLERTRKTISDEIDIAHRVDIVARIDELGRQAISFAHKVDPLRWRLNLASRTVRLINEAGADHDVEVERYDLTRPDQRLALDRATCLAGVAVESPGGLYNARVAGRAYRAVISMPIAGTLSDLRDLGIDQALKTYAEPELGVYNLALLLRLWSKALPLGPLALLRKNATLELLTQGLARIACGREWADAAAALGPERRQLAHVQAGVGGSPGFGSRMKSTAWSAVLDDDMRDQFSGHANTYGVSSDRVICDLALMLAFAPRSIALRTPGEARTALQPVLTNRTLVRGAFLARYLSMLAPPPASDAGVA